jgi:hypothetical protein
MDSGESTLARGRAPLIERIEQLLGAAGLLGESV